MPCDGAHDTINELQTTADEAQAPKGARDIVGPTQVKAARDQRRLRAPAPQSFSGARPLT